MLLLDASSTATQICLTSTSAASSASQPCKKLKQRGSIKRGETGGGGLRNCFLLSTLIARTGLRQTTAIYFSSQKQYHQLIFSSNINIAYAVHQHQLFRTHTAYIRFPYLEPLCGRNALKALATSYLSNSEMWQKKSL